MWSHRTPGHSRDDLVGWYWEKFRTKAATTSDRLMGQVIVEATVNPDLKKLLARFFKGRRRTIAEVVDRGRARGDCGDVDASLLMDLISGTLDAPFALRRQAASRERRRAGGRRGVARRWRRPELSVPRSNLGRRRMTFGFGKVTKPEPVSYSGRRSSSSATTSMNSSGSTAAISSTLDERRFATAVS